MAKATYWAPVSYTHLVGIGGEQTGIYPIASPGGWQLIGRTPLKLFDPASGTLPYAAGDRICLLYTSRCV